MSNQDTYPSVQPVTVAGASKTMLRGDRLSRTVEGANIGFGKAVKRGTTDRSCVAFNGGIVLGITLLDRGASGFNASTQVTTVDTYGVGEDAIILPPGCGGDVSVVCATGCAAGDSVYVRPSNGDFQNSSANSAVQIPGAVYDNTVGAAGLAVVRLA